jgi:hypothetical protein
MIRWPSVEKQAVRELPDGEVSAAIFFLVNRSSGGNG